MQLTISKKLLLSYLAMALLTVLASTYAIVSLQNLNGLAYSIINRDFYALETSRKMMDTLLAQESAEKKFLILKDPYIADIFWMRSREFKNSVDDLKKNYSSGIIDKLEEVSELHSQYDELFNEEVTLVNEDRIVTASGVSELKGKEMIEKMALTVRAIQQKAERNIDMRMNLIKSRSIEAFRITVILILISLAAGFSLALLITYDISKPLEKLKKATSLIAEGRFDHDLKIRRQDEIGSLASAFEVMTERLKELEALNLDASPLTGLPGNMAIEQEIEKRLSEKTMFSLCHVDLDNFKPFADKYGYAWGSEIIKEVAEMLTYQLNVWGQEDDFIGHVGGDDFILVSEPGRAEAICKQILADFDHRIMNFYSEKDRQEGFIIGKDRKGNQQKFPLITITIAIVSDDGTHFKNSLEMAKKAAELKELAKMLPGNNCVKQDNLEGNLYIKI